MVKFLYSSSDHRQISMPNLNMEKRSTIMGFTIRQLVVRSTCNAIVSFLFATLFGKYLSAPIPTELILTITATQLMHDVVLHYSICHARSFEQITFNKYLLPGTISLILSLFLILEKDLIASTATNLSLNIRKVSLLIGVYFLTLQIVFTLCSSLFAKITLTVNRRRHWKGNGNI